MQGLLSAIRALAPPWANAGSCKNHFRLPPELVQALLPLQSWKEATLAGGLEFSLVLMLAVKPLPHPPTPDLYMDPCLYPGDLQVSTHVGTGVNWETGMILLEGKDLSAQSSQAPQPSHLSGTAGSGVGFIKEQYLSKKA